MGIVEGLLPELDREITITRQLLERLPDEKFDWKPHAKSFTLGELASHLASIPTWGSETLARSACDFVTSPRPALLTSRGAVLASFDGATAAARAALVGKTDPELLAVWTLMRNGTPVFSMPKAGVLRSFVLSHLIHHRGQLSVYLRLLDVPVPSIYGPSGDEPVF